MKMEAIDRYNCELNDIIKKVETSKLTDYEVTNTYSRLEYIQGQFDYLHVPKDDENYQRLIDIKHKISLHGIPIITPIYGWWD